MDSLLKRVQIISSFTFEVPKWAFKMKSTLAINGYFGN